jgi:hypothetical protein
MADAKPYREGWWERHGVTVLLWLFILAVLGAAGYIGYRAWHLVKPSDFYAVAVPGLSTGAGTLILAAVTVWLARYQARRDSENRRKDAAARSAERQEERSAIGLREARKVIVTWTRDQDEKLNITNAGRETIVEVFLVSAVAINPDRPQQWWEWSAKDVADEIFRGRTPSRSQP